MKTFLIDLHGGLARLGPAAPLLYPLRADHRLELLPDPVGVGSGRSADELAAALRIALLRDYAPRWLALFLVDLPSDGSRGLLDQLAEIRARFLMPLVKAGLPAARVLLVAIDTIDREPHTGAPSAGPARERWKEDVAGLRGGASSVLEDAAVLRFPLRRSPEPRFQQDLVRLVYCLTGLIELFRSDEVLPRGSLYSVDQVALDPEEVAGWMEEYVECLERARRDVTQRLDHPEPVTLQLIENPDCACKQTLPQLQLQKPGFRWLQGRDDQRQWRGWWQATGASLDGQVAAGEELLRRCRQERRADSFKPSPVTVSALEERVSDLADRLAAARRSLQAEPSAREEEQDWQREMRLQTPRASVLIESRPRPRALVVSLAVLLLLLLAATLLTLPVLDYRLMLVPAALLLVGTAGATALALRTLNSRLALHSHRSLRSAQGMAAAIRARVERRRRQMERLCTVEVARRNHAEAETALRRRAREVQLLRNHRAALEHHLDLAAALQRTQARELQPGGGSAAPPASRTSPARDWEIELPPHLHPTYTPARCSGTRTEETHELHVRARRAQWTSSLTRGLRHIRIVEDPAYATAPMAAEARPGGAAAEER